MHARHLTYKVQSPVHNDVRYNCRQSKLQVHRHCVLCTQLVNALEAMSLWLTVFFGSLVTTG